MTAVFIDAEVQRTLSELGKDAIDKINFNRLGLKARQLVLERTKQQKDVDNNKFADYSAKYAAFKASKGHTGGVNLFDSGNMLASMTVSSNKKSAKLFSADEGEAKKAFKHNNGFKRMPKRQFFGMSKQDEVVLVSMAKRDIES